MAKRRFFGSCSTPCVGCGRPAKRRMCARCTRETDSINTRPRVDATPVTFSSADTGRWDIGRNCSAGGRVVRKEIEDDA